MRILAKKTQAEKKTVGRLTDARSRRRCWHWRADTPRSENYFFDIWEKWGRHTWEKRVDGIEQTRLEVGILGHKVQEALKVGIDVARDHGVSLVSAQATAQHVRRGRL